MTLDELNNLERPHLLAELKKCCGSKKWSDELSAEFPFADKEHLLLRSDEIWNECERQDYLEAFAHHPKIGDTKLKEKYADTADWAQGEQSGVAGKGKELLEALAECNRLYEEKFGYIFIINATGRSAEEILGTLRWRLLNTPDDEIRIAAEEQNEITKIRLEKLLA